MKNKETLEEAAERYSSNELSKLGFINGAKWQQERMYSEEDMIESFNAGGKHIYECEANRKDEKCYCRNDNDCNHRHYISAKEWLKNYH